MPPAADVRLPWMSDAFIEHIQTNGRDFPIVPGATAVVQYHFTDSPMGTVSVFEEIEDGRMMKLERGHAENPDAVITLAYADYKQLVRDRRSSEDLPSRKVTGDLEKLARLAEVHKMPEYQAMRETYADRIVWPDEDDATEDATDEPSVPSPRIAIPDGADPFYFVMSEIGSPILNQRLRQSWQAQYLNDSTLTARERETARARSAHYIGCASCLAWRPARDLPGYSHDEIPEDLYTHVLAPAAWPGYTERERLCIEFAERYAENYSAMCHDEEMWARLRDAFSDTELADLCLLCGVWEGAARAYHLLVGDTVACAVPAPSHFVARSLNGAWHDVEG